MEVVAGMLLEKGGGDEGRQVHDLAELHAGGGDRGGSGDGAIAVVRVEGGEEA